MTVTAAAIQAVLGSNPMNAQIVRSNPISGADSTKQDWYVVGNVDTNGRDGWVTTYAADTATTQAGVILEKLRYRARAVPPGLLPLPIKLLAVDGVGHLSVNYTSATDAAIAFLASAYNSTACTVGSGGTDSVSGGNTFFATPSFACTTWTGGSIVNCISDGVYNGIDLRNTSTSQGSGRLMKIVKGNGFNVIFRTSAAVDPTTATWTADGVLTNIYGTPSSWLASSAQVTRVLRIDVNDDYGYSTPFVKYTTKAALAAATGTDGFFWDNSGKQLWVHLAGDLNVESNKAILKCLFLDTGGNSRIITSGAALALDGVRMEGMQTVTLDALSAGTTRQSLWLNNVTQLWATAKGYDGTLAGEYVSTNSLVYASQADGANAFAPSVTTGEGLIQTYNSRFIRNGDSRTFALDGTLQGISAHGGSHHVSFGSTFLDNNGAGIGDATLSGSADVSWLVGNYIGPQSSALLASTANIEFGAGSGGTRKAYLEANISVKGGSTNDLEIFASQPVYTYGTSLPAVTGGTVVPYTPDNPV